MGCVRKKWHSFGQQLAAILNVPFSAISSQFYHMPEIYERVHVGWHCAKAKGHAELNIENPRVKTLI